MRPCIKTQGGVRSLVPACPRCIEDLGMHQHGTGKFPVCFMPLGFKDPKGFKNDEQDVKCADSLLIHRKFGLNASSRGHKDVQCFQGEVCWQGSPLSGVDV